MDDTTKLEIKTTEQIGAEIRLWLRQANRVGLKVPVSRKHIIKFHELLRLIKDGFILDLLSIDTSDVQRYNFASAGYNRTTHLSDKRSLCLKESGYNTFECLSGIWDLKILIARMRYQEEQGGEWWFGYSDEQLEEAVHLVATMDDFDREAIQYENTGVTAPMINYLKNPTIKQKILFFLIRCIDFSVNTVYLHEPVHPEDKSKYNSTYGKVTRLTYDFLHERLFK